MQGWRQRQGLDRDQVLLIYARLRPENDRIARLVERVGRQEPGWRSDERREERRQVEMGH